MLHDLMALAACEGNTQFDFATFCRIYVEYMCASAGSAMCMGRLSPHVCAAISSGRSASASKVNKRTGAAGNMNIKTRDSCLYNLHSAITDVVSCVMIRQRI